ncbi:MAG: DUF1727 domain-containing protein [Chloroflexi bacterium]|nr:DUF1727 domain-containing protein [Chloroflexota bacterium]
MQSPMGPRLQTTAAVALARLAGVATRHLGGGGTSLPGLIAQSLDGNIVTTLAGQLPLGSVLVTGTNGKTTTTRMIANVLDRMRLVAVHNRSGSNLMRGLATTLVSRARLDGHLPVGPRTIGLFEVDEAVLPLAVRAVRPRLVVLTNLFRDQLDRYGEVDVVSMRWQEAVAALPPTARVVLNADDPAVASLGRDLGDRAITYGVEDVAQALPGLEHAADSKWCHHCGAGYRYERSFYGHLGHYACPSCDWRRPAPSIAAERVDLHGFGGSIVAVRTPAGRIELRVGLPGLYNVYNALAALAAAWALDVPMELIQEAIEATTAAFGRVERLTIAGRTVYLVLAKNPTGLNQVIRVLQAEAGPKRLLVVLNDNIADGRDISWIWDADFERLAGGVADVVCSGIRAEDLALRLKYAGVGGLESAVGSRQSAVRGPASAVGQKEGSSSATREGLAPGQKQVPHAGLPPPDCRLPTADCRLTVERDLARAFDLALARTPAGETLYVVPTYTAMLDLRKILARAGHVEHFLESA